MATTHFSKASFKFLNDLKKNNTRPWFQENKDRYDLMNTEAKGFIAALEKKMNEEDQIERAKLFRIYRDVRFSKDKTPYKSFISMSLSREKPQLRGGYYLQISPGNESVLACGFWNPSPADLKLIRQNIDYDTNNFIKAINAPSVLKHFGNLQGDQVKSAPKGYRKDHPAIEWLRFKQLIFSKSLSDIDIQSESFLNQVVDSYKAIRPFFDYMSDMLTHDINGVPLYE